MMNESRATLAFIGATTRSNERAPRPSTARVRASLTCCRLRDNTNCIRQPPHPDGLAVSCLPALRLSTNGGPISGSYPCEKAVQLN